MTIEVVQKDKLYWLLVNGEEIGSSKLECEAIMAGEKLFRAACNKSTYVPGLPARKTWMGQ